MSSGVVSGLVTAVLLVLFVAGWAWAWSSRRRQEFDAAARIPLDEDARAPQARTHTEPNDGKHR